MTRSRRTTFDHCLTPIGRRTSRAEVFKAWAKFPRAWRPKTGEQDERWNVKSSRTIYCIFHKYERERAPLMIADQARHRLEPTD